MYEPSQVPLINLSGAEVKGGEAGDSDSKRRQQQALFPEVRSDLSSFHPLYNLPWLLECY